MPMAAGLPSAGQLLDYEPRYQRLVIGRRGGDDEPGGGAVGDEDAACPAPGLLDGEEDQRAVRERAGREPAAGFGFGGAVLEGHGAVGGLEEPAVRPGGERGADGVFGVAGPGDEPGGGARPAALPGRGFAAAVADGAEHPSRGPSRSAPAAAPRNPCGT